MPKVAGKRVSEWFSRGKINKKERSNGRQKPENGTWFPRRAVSWASGLVSAQDRKAPASLGGYGRLHGCPRGNFLMNKYQVGKALGSGAFATCRIGVHKESGEKVAIKSLLRCAPSCPPPPPNPPEIPATCCRPTLFCLAPRHGQCPGKGLLGRMRGGRTE